MALSLKHAFQSLKADGPDTTLVQPSNWNEEHVLQMATNRILGRTTASTGSVEELTVGANLLLSAGTLALATNPAVSGNMTVAGTLGVTLGVTLSSTLQVTGAVGVGGAASSEAALDVQSTTKGFYLPRMTTAQRDAIATPGTGLLIYNTTTSSLEVYNGSWGAVAPAGLSLASQAEAEAGVENTKVMTSLRVNQATTARLASQAEAEAGSDATKLMTPQRVAQAIAALASGGTVDYQEFTASGTWTKPSGISADAVVLVEMWGAGGSGARNPAGGGGGGGGAYVRALFRASDLSSTVAVAVGSGGAGVGPAGQVNGNAGGNSTFGSTLLVAGGGAGAGVGSDEQLGGAGGTISHDKSVDACWASYENGGTGGSSAGGGPAVSTTNSGAGGASAAADASTITGATSVFGGNGGNGSRATPTDGSIPGGGGGGVETDGSPAALTGAGARGEVRVWTIG